MAEPLGHGLVLEFDVPDAEFARGFEAGRIWEALRGAPDESVEEVVHASNAEMFLRMGESLGRRVCAEDLDERWLKICFSSVDDALDA